MRVRPTTLAWIVVTVLVFAAPFGMGLLALKSFLDVAVLAIVVLSSNLLTGMAGQISIAQGAFLGIGAYTTAILLDTGGWSPWAALPVAVAVATTVSAVAGLPALRIRGINLALVTLAIALVFPTLVLRLGEIGGGPNGITVDSPMAAPPGFFAGPQVWTYWVLMAITVAAFVLMRNVFHSRTGRQLLSVKDHALLAASMGVDVRKVTLSAFAGSGALAGLAGWMFTVHHQFVSPADFGLLLSINILLAMTLGGAGTLAGPIIGAAFLRYSPDLVADGGVTPILVPAVQGVILILALLLLPRGIAGLRLPRRFRRPPRDEPAEPTTPSRAAEPAH